ncbi:MAG: Hpt domain-containing protein [Planctomycetota bacterium]
MPDPTEPNATPLRSEFADDPDMAELIELFVAEMPDRVSELHRSLESGDIDQLESIAHQLKGACGGYGFEVIGHAAAALEQVVRSGERDVSALRSEVESLVTLCSRAIA